MSPFPWIEGVTQTISEEIEGQDRDENREAWPDCHPGLPGEEALRRIKHRTP